MFIYKKYQPETQLEPFIVCYYYFEYTADEVKIIQSPPSGYAAIIFNLGDPYEACTGSENTFQRLTNCILAGQQTKNYKIKLSGAIRQLGIVFKPTAITTLLNFPMRGLVNKRINLDEVLGDHVQVIYTSLKTAASVEALLKIVHGYFSSCLYDHEKRINVADMAADLIWQNKGNITVELLMDELCVSRRHLERKFVEKTGVTPKHYCRIVRMAFISNIVAHHEKIDWQDLVYQGGFHDQNHFIKDFKALNDMSPARYHQEHSELPRFLEKKKTP